MTTRPNEHVISDIALKQIELELSKCGWACEEIKRDYGEDLLVQTTKTLEGARGGKVDVFKTLVQAKGKEEVNSQANGSWSVSIDKEHLLRWLNLREPLLFVVWDENSNSGRFCIPKSQHSLAEVLASSQASFTLNLVSNDEMCKERLLRLAWTLRVDYYAEVIGLARLEYNDLHAEIKYSGTNSHGDVYIEQIRSNLNILLDMFLEEIEVLHEGEIPQSIKNRLNTDIKEGEKINPNSDDLQFKVCESAVFQEVQKRTGSGLTMGFANRVACRLQEHLNV